jgi:hypothetical protein
VEAAAEVTVVVADTVAAEDMHLLSLLLYLLAVGDWVLIGFQD